MDAQHESVGRVDGQGQPIKRLYNVAYVSDEKVLQKMSYDPGPTEEVINLDDQTLDVFQMRPNVHEAVLHGIHCRIIVLLVTKAHWNNTSHLT